MKYRKQDSNYLKDGFEIPTFVDYVKARLEKMREPLKVPCYAMKGEAERIDKLYAAIQKNPYEWFSTASNIVSQKIESLKARPILHSADPLLYNCIMDACAALKIEKPSAFSYSEGKEMKHNAFAAGYFDMMWIFISEEFRALNLMKEAELCFIMGHELGHVAAYHSAVRLQSGKGTAYTQEELSPEELHRREMTADRAGLLAVLWHISKRYPDMDPEEMMQRTLDACRDTLHKLTVLPRLDKKKKEKQSLAALEAMMEKYPIKEEHASKKDSHPSNWERVEAMKLFIAFGELKSCAISLWGADHIISREYRGEGIREQILSGHVLS